MEPCLSGFMVNPLKWVGVGCKEAYRVIVKISNKINFIVI